MPLRRRARVRRGRRGALSLARRLGAPTSPHSGREASHARGILGPRAPCDAGSVDTAAVDAAPRPPVRERVEAILAEYLGRQTSATAVRIAARTWLRVEPEAVTLDQLQRLCFGLEPMVKTLLGAAVAATLLDRIRREVVP